MHTADQKVSDKIFQIFTEFEVKLEQAKMQVKFATHELDELVLLNAEESATNIKSMFPPDNEAEHMLQPSLEDRLNLDALQLKQRALESK